VARAGLSWWWDSLPDDLTQPLGEPLQSDTEADVAIVGAGFTGLWTAYYLTELNPHLSIVIIDAAWAGFGASGRNGGWASALFPASLDAIARRSSAAGAIALTRALQDTVVHLGAVADAEGWDIHYQRGGTVQVARNPAHVARLQAEVAHSREWGLDDSDLTWLSADQAREVIGASNVLGATYTPHCAAIHPARLVRLLAQAVVSRGVRLHEGTVATSIEPRTVRTPYGIVRARYVVRATEGYTRSLRGQRRALAPIYSLMIATEPLPSDLLDSIGLSQRATFTDGRHLIIYGQRTADGRIAFGGRGAPYHFGSRVDPRDDVNDRIHDALIRTLGELLPALRDVPITHRWGGPLGVPRDWMSSVGLDQKTGLAWSSGYVGDGVAASNLGARTLAHLITGQDSPLTRLPWVNHPSPTWEVEPLRWLGANAGLAVMSSADGVEGRTGRPARRAEVFGRLLGH